MLVIISLIFSSFGYVFKENKPVSILKDLIKKVKLKINYVENPNQADFFKTTDMDKYTKIGPFENLTGSWTGTYVLNQESVFWTNSQVERSSIFKLIDFKSYDIYFKFNHSGKFPKLEIGQEGTSYSSVNIEIANDKQISYWAEAVSLNWREIIRGKIFRLNNDALYTVFQTTVYERKIPIYAFSGEVVLKRL